MYRPFVITLLFITTIWFQSDTRAADLAPADTSGPPAPRLETAAPNDRSCDALKSFGTTSDELARRGCCSWHGGVCGCEGDRAVCCDGKFSPTGGCNRVDPPKPGGPGA